jgi:IclR family KDG regulon transcriptional repressor
MAKTSDGMPKTGQGGPRLSSVATAIRLLRAFDGNDLEIGVSELAKRLGIAKSTAHRLASTLVSEGLLGQNADTGRYRLGIGLFTLGSMVRLQFNLSSGARSLLTELRDAENIVFLHDFESPHMVRLKSSTGQIKPAFCTAEGMCLLASLAEAELAALLKTPRVQRTEKTLVGEAEIRRSLDEVRKNGYAVEDEESEEGTRCIAAPVQQADGRVVAAVGLAGPRLRMKKRLFPTLIPQLLSTAKQISRQMGYQRA